MIWYGMGGEEARSLCQELCKQAHFSVTLEPRLVSSKQTGSAKSADSSVKVDGAVLAGDLRVIKALESESDVCFTLGLFADPPTDGGERL